MQDSIEKTIELNAPIERVWRALTDHTEFGQWFRVKLDTPFAVGKVTHGRVTYPGYEHMKWSARVQELDPERRFSFTWCPLEEDSDKADAPQTLVEFVLEATDNGTRLTITESGFDSLPDDARRVDALRRNTQGWEAQVQNIAAYVAS